MLFTKKIKIWILVTHGIIVVGAGHGVAFLFLLEIIPVVGLSASEVTGADAIILFTSLLCIVGQVCLLLSIRLREAVRKKVLQILGVVFLWLSVCYLAFESGDNLYGVIVWISVIPFLVCTVSMFFGGLFRDAYNRIVDK